MKTIDFLPESYHHQRALRHARLCWLGVGVVFGLVIAGAASGQWVLRKALEVQVRQIEPQYALAQQRQTEITKVLAARKHAAEAAALYSYLEYPWPRTQLLAAVSNPLPASIQLTRIHIVEQAGAAPAARRGDKDVNHTPNAAEQSTEISPL